jgi:hypothetical protein
MTIADVLYDATDDIRDYINEDGLESYSGLAREITHIVAIMDELRATLDRSGPDTRPATNQRNRVTP